MCNSLELSLTEQVTISRKRKSGECYHAPVFKQPKVTKIISRKVPTAPTRIYSNNMSDCIKTFCCECDEVVNMSGLRKHLRRHGMGLVEYRNLYGDHYTQVIQMVFHTCMYCKEDIVLDYDTLKKHLRIVHRMTTADYTMIRRGSKQASIFSIQKPMGMEMDVKNGIKNDLQMGSEIGMTAVIKEASTRTA